MESNNLVSLMDAMCRIDSYIDKKRDGSIVGGEKSVADFIVDKLKQIPWLTVSVDEVAPGRPNVFAYTGSPEDIKLLIVGHIDTVSPSEGWTKEQFTQEQERYYALGASDAKGGIAAVLDVLQTCEPTEHVGFLFYVDEETTFIGMEAFLKTYSNIKPELIFSVCGAKAALLTGCRGDIECSFVVRGKSAHAARPESGVNAIEVAQFAVSALKDWCATMNEPYRTTCNLAELHGGTPAASGEVEQGNIPAFTSAPNKVPNYAWALLDIRTGSSDITEQTIQEVLTDAISKWNLAHDAEAKLESFSTHFNVSGCASPEGSFKIIEEDFKDIFEGRYSSPGERGYIDVAMFGDRVPEAGIVMMSPLAGNEHGTDEWIDVPSLVRYRDAMQKLLARFVVDRK